MGEYMLKVVCVVDKERTALDRIARGVIPYHKNLDYKVIAVHPKRPSIEQLEEFEREARTADIMDYQYFRTAEMLRDRYDWLKQIPSVLTHNNPYSINESKWVDYQMVVGNNESIFSDLKDIAATTVRMIPLAVNPYFWTYKQDYEAPRSVIMVANRIESKKGILPVALACKKLGVKMTLVGAVSQLEYWQEVMATGAVEYAQEITDEQLRDLYHQSGIHVCNSVDGFESGTLPILEAIYCGIPVLTRRIGHVPDFETEDNIVIQDSDPEDVENIANKLTEMFADKKKLDKQRHEAWMGIKDKNFERRAYAYQKIYRELMGDRPVSVIMPVSNKPEFTKKSVNAVFNQTHKNLELIIVDDGESQEETVKELALTASIPVRYIKLDQEGYNLAQARNIGAIEATGDILVFCDQRIVMEENAIEEFIKKLTPKSWLWGSKGVKKDFIENFTCIYREDFVGFGMFNERCDRYGALSQETRVRARQQGLHLEYVAEAKAIQEGKSSNKWQKKLEIMESKNMLWKIGL